VSARAKKAIGPDAAGEGLGDLSQQEVALIRAKRRIPAADGEQFHRTQSIIEFVNALADGMRSANA
jgi:hypothetical protein